MKNYLIFITFYFLINFQALAEFQIDYSKSILMSSEAIKLTKNGILLGEYGFNSSSMPFNGIYFDNTGNLEFKPKVLGSFKITDVDEDASYYYATSYMTINGLQGLFKISKDFSEAENIGIKAGMRKLLPYKDKVYEGGYVHGCYVVNKDGSNLTQILGDGYYGPYIDDIKANSKNVYILSRGLLYKVNYDSNTKEQLIFGYRPSTIEVDEERLYLTSSNTFFYLSFDNKVSNQKYFPNNVTFMKKYQNIIIITENDPYYTYFWISKDSGKNFFKSNTKILSTQNVKDIEIVGEKNYTVYLNLLNYGVVKADLTFDFQDKKIFSPPFKLSKDTDIMDKISAFFDHRYPYLGNTIEPNEYKNTTMNFEGKELKEPLIYYSSHDGIDWALPLNTPIYSVYQGEATYFYQENGLGNAIKVSHPNGYITIYGHLSDEDLVTKDKNIQVTQGQKIGKVGVTGNTTGPHLHFTTYFGEKILNNKVDPFGWKAKFTDPWSDLGGVSFDLWNLTIKNTNLQFLPSNSEVFQNENLTLNIQNLSFINYPVSLEIEKSPPIYDYKNFTYFPNSSYRFIISELSSQTIPQSILGTVSYSGFHNGDDKFYSIWRFNGQALEKQPTSYDMVNNKLSTLFEPSSEYLILKDTFKKISIKNKSTAK